MTPGRLSPRALNRAALHRQLLLDRAPLTALAAVGRLAGLQAQAPLAPYVGLWTRLAGFRHEELKELITERAVLRAHLMRNTVHLVDAADYLRFRPLYQPVLARHLAGNFGKNLIGVDLAELAAAAADLLGQTPLTRVELAARLAPRWPDHDPASLAYAASHLLPLVQVPPRGLWGEPNHRAAFFLASAWLAARDPAAPPGPPRDPGHPATPAPRAPGPTPMSQSTMLEQLVLRYLAAYGPASVADAQAWSGLTRLREVTERLASSAPRLHRPGRRRTAGPAGRAAPGPGRPGAAPLPARIRQPAALLRRTHPGHPAPPPGPAAARARRDAGERCSSTACGRPTGRSARASWRSSRSSR